MKTATEEIEGNYTHHNLCEQALVLGFIPFLVEEGFLCFGLRKMVLAEFTSTKGSGTRRSSVTSSGASAVPKPRLHGSLRSGPSSAPRLCRATLSLLQNLLTGPRLPWLSQVRYGGPDCTPRGASGSCSCDSELVPPEGSRAWPRPRVLCCIPGGAGRALHTSTHTAPREWSGVTPRPCAPAHIARELCVLRMRSHLVALCSVTFYEFMSRYLIDGNAIAEETRVRNVRRDGRPGGRREATISDGSRGGWLSSVAGWWRTP